MYTLTIKHGAFRCLRKLPLNIRRVIEKELERLSANPDDNSLDIKPIEGTNYLRLCFKRGASPLSAIFTCVDTILILCVYRISPRGQAYDPKRLR